MNFEEAIKLNSNRNYRLRNNKYEAYITENSHFLSLGTHDNEEDAEYAVLQYRINRFINAVKNYGLNPYDGLVYKQNYVAFCDGSIFNLQGHKMTGHVDKCGYRQIIINNKNEFAHRIIALCFLDQIPNKDFVNHKDGNKLNNNVNNLEWCDRSENTQHSYNNYLQDNVTNQYGNYSIITEQDKTYIKDNLWRTKITQQTVADYLGISMSTVQKILYDNYECVYSKIVSKIMSLKTTYEGLGHEINKCAKSVRKMVKALGGDVRYEIPEYESIQFS